MASSIRCPLCFRELARDEVHSGPADCINAGRATAEPPNTAERASSAILPRGTSELLTVSIDQISVADNVRADLGDLDELAASIKAVGLLQPIGVHRSHSLGPRDLYVVDHGHRRLAACQLAGLTEISVVVEPERTGVDRPIAQLVENIQRRDLGPLEEARAYRAILDADPAMTQKALADQVGKAPATISNALRLLELTPEVQTLVEDGSLSGAHAKAIASLPDADQVALATQATTAGWSSHTLEENVAYRVRQVEGRTKIARQTEKAVVKALDLLAERRVSMTEPLILSCSYELDADAVKTALRTVGFTLSGAWRTEPRAKTACDCETLRLEVNGNAGVGLVEVCANSMHLDALYAARQSENNTKHAAEEALLDEIEAAALAIWKASPPHPIIARLLLRYLENYSGQTWTEYMSQDDAQVIEKLISRAVGTAHGAKPLPAKTVLAALLPPTEQSLAAERVAAKRAERRAQAVEA